MDIKVKNLYIKVSPRKVRPVLFGVRGKNALEARTSLLFTNKKGAKMLASLLKSALAIAKENDLEENKLTIKSVYCNEGPRLKRRQVKARGRSDQILKRMSNLYLVLTDEAVVVDTKKSDKKSDKPVTKKNNAKGIK